MVGLLANALVGRSKLEVEAPSFCMYSSEGEGEGLEGRDVNSGMVDLGHF